MNSLPVVNQAYLDMINDLQQILYENTFTGVNYW